MTARILSNRPAHTVNVSIPKSLTATRSDIEAAQDNPEIEYNVVAYFGQSLTGRAIQRANVPTGKMDHRGRQIRSTLLTDAQAEKEFSSARRGHQRAAWYRMVGGRWTLVAIHRGR